MQSLQRGFYFGVMLLGWTVSAHSALPESTLNAPGPAGLLKGSLLGPISKSTASILIIPGSGPTDRDGNSPMGVTASTYRLLAEDLAARGLTTLRIDKRGMFYP